MLGQVLKVFLQEFESDGIKYPAGTVAVVVTTNNSPLSTIVNLIYARPSGDVGIPVNGEYVQLEYAPGDITTNLHGTSACYYTHIIPIYGNINSNVAPPIYTAGIVKANTPQNQIITDLPETDDFVNSNIIKTQPYVGDKILYGRFGNSIRLGTTFKRFSQTVNTQPTWTGTADGSPITIISNKNDAGVEDLSTNNSYIFLTHDQKLISFRGAQRKLGPSVVALSAYTKPQIAISSTRVVLNAYSDFIILNSYKSIIFATKNWAADHDATLTLFDGLVAQVSKLVTTLITAASAGSISTILPAATAIQSSIVKIKSRLGLMKSNISNVQAPATNNIPSAITDVPYTGLDSYELLSEPVDSSQIVDSSDVPYGDLNPIGFISPMRDADYVVKSKFGRRIPPKAGASSNHGGIDFGTRGKIGYPIYAIADGNVRLSGYQDPGNKAVGYGLRMYVTHKDGFESVYAHLSNTPYLVGQNQPVKQGDIIGYSGNTGNSTGPHLHFELHKNGIKVDPLLYIPQIKTT